MMATFGERLRSLRDERRKTQKEIAKQFKLAESSISMYERDERSPSQELTKDMAEFFEVSTDYLLGHSDVRNAEGMLSDVPSKAKRIIHSLARAKELDDEDYDIIAKQVDDFIAYAKAKKNKGSS